MALINCPECTKEVSDQAPSCIHCGFPLKRSPPAQAPAAAKGRLLEDNPAYNGAGNTSQAIDSYYSPPQVVRQAKSRGIFVILALFFGCLGVHNFYAGYFGRGAVQLLITVLLGWLIIGLVVTVVWSVGECFMTTVDAVGDIMV